MRRFSMTSEETPKIREMGVAMYPRAESPVLSQSKNLAFFAFWISC